MTNQTILDLATEAMTQQFLEAKIYTKKGIVVAREVETEEKIVTVLKDGTVETENITQKGDYVVTNPSGEQYVLPAEKFWQRYELTSETGTYKAKGMIRTFPNPTGQPATIVPSWGGTQTGATNCMFATPYDPVNPNHIGADRYIIGYNEFLETYKPAE